MDANNVSIITTLADGPIRPVFMNSFLAAGHLIYALFGIVLNVTIIICIIALRRLRRQSRNIIWIGIGFSNIFVLFTNLLEPIEYYSPQTTELCGIHSFLAGFPGSSFLMYNFFFLVERYLSIFHSVWYRRCVTVRLVIGIQLAAFIILFFLMKSHYIFGFVQVECNVAQPLDRSIYISFIAFFLILCLSGHLTVFRMIKKHLKLANKYDSTNRSNDTTANDREVEAYPSTRNIGQNGLKPASHHPTDNNEVAIIAPKDAVPALGLNVQSKKTKNNLHFVRIRDQMVSRLELEATRNVIISVGIMLLFTSPWIITSFLAQICNGNIIRQVMDEKESTEPLVGQCSRYFWAISYSRLILLIGHSIYQSVFSVTRSKDLSFALGRGYRDNECFGVRRPADEQLSQIHPHPQRRRKMYRRAGHNTRRLRTRLPPCPSMRADI